jgi:peptide/nickel transport system permease protein
MSVKAILRSDFLNEFRKSKGGVAGIVILFFLVAMSIYAATSVPLDSFRQWNNPSYWIKYPKSAMPSWTNIFASKKQPEHLIMDKAIVKSQIDEGIRTVKYAYKFAFNYDFFPSDFMINYGVRYNSTPPLVDVELIRPDGESLAIISTSLPSAQSSQYTFRDTIFSTESEIKDNLRNYINKYSYAADVTRPEIMLFSARDKPSVLKGTYTLVQTFSFFDEKGNDKVVSSEFILGGKVYGLLGTDEFRHDLSIGILWGTPVALFIGLSVAIVSTFVGLIYGLVAAYRGRKTDPSLMMVVQIIINIPTLFILIILSITIGRNIFLIVGYFILFGWVGMALISRSMGLQIKTYTYIEAAKLMGESDIRIIFRHIIPQLLPFAFASIALSVPSAILGESGLSFLGLGDPTIPTWGKILYDAQSSDAAARGIWWWIAPPGIMIGITGAAFVLIARALESIVNPKMIDPKMKQKV